MILLKKFLCFILCAILLCGTTVLAAEKEVSVDVDKSYTSAYKGESLDDVAKAVGMTADELESYFDKNGVLFLAANKDNSIQVRISSYENEFSELVGDLSALSEAEIKQVADELKTSDQAEYRLYNTKKYKFILFSELLTDSGGQYISEQYITAKDGKIYQISIYMLGHTSFYPSNEILESFVINTDDASFPLWLAALFVIGIAAFVSLAAVMVIGIIKEKHKDVQGDTNEDIQ